MAKLRSTFICNQCGFETSKWIGKCPECNNWNCMEEQIKNMPSTVLSNKLNIKSNNSIDNLMSINNIDTSDEIRFKTGISELDRVLGGGIVQGSLILIGGAPGIGKSTLLLQICEYLGANLSILYVSGEESIRQLKLRAIRLNVNSENLYILASTDVDTICTTILSKNPDMVIIDSIQTMCIAAIASSPGSITQVRESTNAFMSIAKKQDIPIFVVGHINKDGAIAGPKILEHIVDAVLYFEGERSVSYRILRAIKNRYGSTNEIGVFEMNDSGLVEVVNPSLMLISGRPLNVSGSCVACIMEGTRPILAEVQALVTKTGFGTPRRTANGFDYNRMNLILAVLEKRAGFFFGNLDAYINVVGGLRLDEPAADLSIALALISSLIDKPIDKNLIAFGEIGLGGEIRSISSIIDRLKEACRLGFTKAMVPKNSFNNIKDLNMDIEIILVDHLNDTITYIK